MTGKYPFETPVIGGSVEDGAQGRAAITLDSDVKVDTARRRASAGEVRVYSPRATRFRDDVND
jgi:hypothetical protein